MLALWRPTDDKQQQFPPNVKRIFFFPITAERHKLYDFFAASVLENWTQKKNGKRKKK